MAVEVAIVPSPKVGGGRKYLNLRPPCPAHDCTFRAKGENQGDLHSGPSCQEFLANETQTASITFTTGPTWLSTACLRTPAACLRAPAACLRAPAACLRAPATACLRAPAACLRTPSTAACLRAPAATSRLRSTAATTLLAAGTAAAPFSATTTLFAAALFLSGWGFLFSGGWSWLCVLASFFLRSLFRSSLLFDDMVISGLFCRSFRHFFLHRSVGSSARVFILLCISYPQHHRANKTDNKKTHHSVHGFSTFESLS
jgi:hypothetical protein